MTGPLPRRRFLGALVGAAAATLAGAPARAAAYRWDGHALGGAVSLTVAGIRRAAAEDAVAACLDEIERLENLFSLFRPDSALSRLNRAGALDDPGPDMVALLARAQSMARLTGGAFDPTVQPLWELHAAGPPAPDALRACLRRVGWRGLSVSPRRIVLGPGMAVSLNGIAQGHITDRVADLLRRRGVGHALVDMGEHRATGPRDAAGAPWRLADRAGGTVALAAGAVATSAPAGTVFEPSGRRHHIFDPRRGTCPRRHRQVTVTAPTATLADALATACHVLDPGQARAVVARLAGAGVAVGVEVVGAGGDRRRL
ncbi:MAG: FAD:protein FMN transferase [Hyphomicrobiales bacterium]|nr:FAD:protein FMN transferase [Hyphomicrobiales bacterium]